jgi:hypothetical protein
MTKEESTIIYKTMKECYDKDIIVFEKCEYVEENDDDIFIDVKLNEFFLEQLLTNIDKSEPYINECLTTIVINDLSDMIPVDNVPKDICETI